MLKICVVIPAYNEEKRIGRTLDNFKSTLIKKHSNNITVLVVSDGSTDRTDSIVREFGKHCRQIRLMRVSEHTGKGGVLKAGFYHACKDPKYDIIGFADADPSVSGAELIKLIDAIKPGRADGVIASRYMGGSRIVGRMTKTRFVASRCYNLMVNLLFGFNFKDTQCGAKFFTVASLRKILASVHLTDMSFDINLLYEMRRHGFTVKEVPITYYMVNEESKVSVRKQIPKMFIVTLSYRITRSPLGRLFPERFRIKVYNRIRKW